MSPERADILIGIAGTASVALVGAIVGGVATFVVQRWLFAEKLKEIVYKERLVSVKKLMQRVGQVHDSFSAGVDESGQLAALMQEAGDFLSFLASERLFISEKVDKRFSIIAFKYVAIAKESVPDERLRRFEGVYADKEALLAVIREEFGIEPLAKQTEWSFKTPSQHVKAAVCRLLPKGKPERGEDDADYGPDEK